VAELVWLNGKITPFAQARVGLEDRGFQFADGVYEVVRFYRSRCFTLDEHMERLEQSATALRIPLPLDRVQLKQAIIDLVDRGGEGEGMVYLQLTRGEAPRAHPFPDTAKPTLLFYTRPLPAPWRPGEGDGIKLFSAADERWKKCWIKSLALLGNVLAKQQAIENGADEAVFIDGEIVTECSASNIFCVKRGSVYTHPVGPKVLPGITRLVVAQLCKQMNVPFVEAALTPREMQAAEEIFITSTTRELAWVREWDRKTVGGGKCGTLTKRLHEGYRDRVRAETGAT
jgi:D-alanine transaminase